jgi:hypothetical protein
VALPGRGFASSMAAFISLASLESFQLRLLHYVLIVYTNPFRLSVVCASAFPGSDALFDGHMASHILFQHMHLCALDAHDPFVCPNVQLLAHHLSLLQLVKAGPLTGQDYSAEGCRSGCFHGWVGRFSSLACCSVQRCERWTPVRCRQRKATSATHASCLDVGGVTYVSHTSRHHIILANKWRLVCSRERSEWIRSLT